jgi:hypothetical protein
MFSQYLKEDTICNHLTVNQLIPFKEIIAAYSEKSMEPTNRLWAKELSTVKAGGTFSPY